MQTNLKIIIIGPAYPLRGGPAQFNENLCSELLKAGHEASIISYSLQYPDFLFPGSSQYETSGKAPEGINIKALINTINPFSWLRTARYIKQQQPDIILFRYWLPFFGPSLGSIGRLAKSNKTVVLALTDNVLPHEKRIGDRAFTSYFIKGCEGFIAMSKTVLNDISRFSHNRPRIYSPHPMYETYGSAVNKQEARQKLGIEQTDRVVLFFGLIRHYKGLDLLLEALADKRLQVHNVKLLIAGEFYEDKEPYLARIHQDDLKDRIILHDKFIANEDLKYYFCACDIVAQTYRKATNSGVTMVGYYYEKPMLVTNTGGLAEIVPNNKCGYVVEQDPKSIADALVNYFEQHREAEFTREVALEKKKYEWSGFIKALIELFEHAKKSRS